MAELIGEAESGIDNETRERLEALGHPGR